jgi:hypothetical protein
MIGFPRSPPHSGICSIPIETSRNVKKELALDVSLHTFLQILFVHSFEKIQLSWAFQGRDDANRDDIFDNQVNLFDS